MNNSNFEIIFYELEDGSVPVAEFIRSLDIKMRAKVLRTVNMLESNGNQLGMPHSKVLEDGILELRVKFGTDISRVLYFFCIGKEIVLTNGFIKKTQTTPQSEIALAKKYRTDFIQKRNKENRL